MRGTKPAMRASAAACTKAPKAPAWLSATARKEWARVAPILVDRKILTDADLGSLQNYCIAIGQVQEAQAALDANGMFFTGENGAIRPHPAVRVQNAAMASARLLAAELGLTPVSRSRPAMNDEPEDNGGFGDLVD